MTKQRLGKGLGALIPEFNKDDVLDWKGQQIMEIPLEKILLNPQQPRKEISPEKLNELADTIKTYGVIQPVIVHQQEEGEQYILVAGERRFKAARLAGLNTIPALVRRYNHTELLEVALVENLQREDLSPLEEAAAFKKLMDEFGLSQEELARKIGRSRSAVANSLRLLTLDDEVKRYLREGKLTVGQVRPLLAITDLEMQRSLALKILEQNLTARQVENMIKNFKKAPRDREGSETKTSGEDEWQKNYFRDLEEQIRRLYGTKVKIKKEAREGKIELFFYSNDDLERLISILLHEKNVG